MTRIISDCHSFFLSSLFYDEGEEAELYDRFYKDLDFGTGGLRGVIGAGTNRMNCYTIRKATQGLANFIIKEGGQEKGVAIAYDSRHMSQEISFATSSRHS